MRAWAATDIAALLGGDRPVAHSMASSRSSWSMWDCAIEAMARACRPPAEDADELGEAVPVEIDAVG